MRVASGEDQPAEDLDGLKALLESQNQREQLTKGMMEMLVMTKTRQE